jgi:ABC-type Fe3+ transport system permease subunit
MNPLMVVSLPPVAVLLAQALQLLPPSLEPLARQLGNARIWAVVVIGYGVLRNLPWPPFSWLAPGGFG